MRAAKMLHNDMLENNEIKDDDVKKVDDILKPTVSQPFLTYDFKEMPDIFTEITSDKVTKIADIVIEQSGIKLEPKFDGSHVKEFFETDKTKDEKEKKSGSGRSLFISKRNSETKKPENNTNNSTSSLSNSGKSSLFKSRHRSNSTQGAMETKVAAENASEQKTVIASDSKLVNNGSSCMFKSLVKSNSDSDVNKTEKKKKRLSNRF